MTTLERLRRDRRLTPANRLVGIEILSTLDPVTGTLRATIEQLAARLGMETGTVSKSTRRLEAFGHLRRIWVGRHIEYAPATERPAC